MSAVNGCVIYICELQLIRKWNWRFSTLTHYFFTHYFSISLLSNSDCYKATVYLQFTLGHIKYCMVMNWSTINCAFFFSSSFINYKVCEPMVYMFACLSILRCCYSYGKQQRINCCEIYVESRPV